MKNSAKYLLLIVAGFLLGLFIFFPWNAVKSSLVSFVSTQSGADLSISSLHGSTGFTLGLSYGSLFGIAAKDLSLSHPSLKASLNCEDATIAPKILPLLWGQIQVGLSCELDNTQEILALLRVKPFWSPTQLSASLELNDLALDTVNRLMGSSGFAGVVNAEIDIEELMLPAGGLPNNVSWSLEAENLQIPALNHSMAKLPSLSFSELVSEGKFSPRRLQIESLNFGSAANPVEGQFKIDFGLNSQIQPVSGEWTGKLRVNPEFEAQRFKDISLNLLFGNADAQGRRSFVKEVEGSFMSLLRPPKN